MSKKQLFQTDTTSKLLFATIANACPHCGKPDWCYSILSFTVWNSDRKRSYALGQLKQSPTYVLSNCQKLNNVQGGIA
ncbi:hypothetical protein [Nostoc sp. CALU 1950]|uniref:hypothetical protein n=1 Tax=Nostoc sp. CALU 1950 TaxID=3104321 RepID=UPI003EB7C838